ncbi:hypothetical protein A9Q91_02585 [Candidatus Gracilibacteria bacterium 28_42_T64]|nr:hypothetical protein A9Q91_02585 [Candidatus Gracilibacteria bacterium 28_42_T64]
MSIKSHKIIQFLIILLFGFLPLINSRLLELFGINISLGVSGNYEFTKVMYFNIISSLIILGYGFQIILNKQRIFISKNSIMFLSIIWLVMLISSYFSTSPFISFFGNNSKAHSFLMWNNLIGISYILFNILDKKLFKQINITIIVPAILLSILGIKELYFPSFDYGGLSNRLLSTFGHPNYVALFLILIIPYVVDVTLKTKNKIKKLIFLGIGILLFITLILTKSAIGIFLGISYLLYSVLPLSSKGKNIGGIITIIIGALLILKFYPEKIHSFVSRFYIWDTTLNIIFSDIKILTLGVGFENLSHFFDIHKSEYLYIFENIGFTADRPHNIFLQFFVHLGIGGLAFISYIYYIILRQLRYRKHYNYSLFLGSIFLLFNFASIASYLIVIVYLIYSIKENSKYKKTTHLIPPLFYFIIISCFALINIFYSYKIYVSETLAYKQEYNKAIEIFPYNPDNFYQIGEVEKGGEIEKIQSEKYFISIIVKGSNLVSDCNNLIIYYPTVENYFYCGEILEKFGFENESIHLYKKGVEKLPDLWNKNSKYHDMFLIKYFVDSKRFLSPKYSRLQEILKKIGK